MIVSDNAGKYAQTLKLKDAHFVFVSFEKVL